MQKFIAIGNLTKDPEGGMTNNGTGYCKFGIAIPRDFKGKNGERLVDFFNCTAWNTLAENICKYCVKGSRVSIIGQVQNRSFEGRGGKQTVTEIVVESVEFLSQKGKEDASPQKEAQNTTKQAVIPSIDDLQPIDDDDMPF